MLALIGLVMTAAAAALGYWQARKFVRRRLAYVEGVHHAATPVLAGAGAWLLALPLAWALPLVGGGSALLFGAGVGFGVAAGARDLRRRLYPG